MIQPLINLVAPTKCLGCEAEGKLICPICRGAITRRPASCYRCNRLSDNGKTCKSCSSSTKLAGVTVAAFYDGVAKDLVLALKFGRQKSASIEAASLLTPLLDASEFDVVTSVPSSPARFRQRGYNQSALLARSIARQLGLPYRELLGRKHQTEQIGAGRRQRLAQIQGAFYSRRPATSQRVLIVDDVLTTGATLSECAKVLRGVGTKRVWGAVVTKH